MTLSPDLRVDRMYKMLVVDDNPKSRESLERRLTSNFPSHEVFVAGSVEEVMRELVANTPNLIFMSNQFSRGTALELCSFLTTRYPKIDVIITSSFDLPEYRKAAHGLGAKYFMAKDTLPDEICEYVRKADFCNSD